MIIEDVFNRTRALLNDLDAIIYTDEVLLPFVQAANDELSDHLISNGVPVQKQIEEDIDVATGEIELTLPLDLIVPVRLFEKADGANDDTYIPMTRKSWEPVDAQTEILQYWVWRNQQILFLGATTDRTVRLLYIRMLAEIVDENSDVEVIGSVNFLSNKVASLAAGSIGGNDVDSQKWELKSIPHRDKLLQIAVRNGQSLRGRRKPFRLRYMRIVKLCFFPKERKKWSSRLELGNDW